MKIASEDNFSPILFLTVVLLSVILLGAKALMTDNSPPGRGMGADFCFLSAIETGRFYHIQKPTRP